MSITAQELTRYFHAVQSQLSLPACPFDRNRPYIVRDYAEIRSGRLEATAARELFTRTRTDTTKTLDVFISIATLHTRNTAQGLAVIPASLKVDGQFSAEIGTQTPWVPAERLRGPGTQDLKVMAGDLSTFWNWRLTTGNEMISRTQGWKDVIAYAEAMVAEVMDTNQIVECLADEGDSEFCSPRTPSQQCWITPGSLIMANRSVLELYDHLIGEKPSVPLYERLLSLEPIRKFSEDGIDESPDVLLRSAGLACGTMSDDFPLTESQRRAVHAFLLDGPGDITAVSGPPGTGKTTMLQAVVATLIVRHCLENRPAPLIVGTSTNNQAVTNIIDSFSSVAKEDAGPLARRWLPTATEDGVSQKPLRGLAAYLPSNAKTKEAREKGYLIEDTRKGGVYTEYSAPEYVQAAVPRFLADLKIYGAQSGFAAPTDLRKAEDWLAKVVKWCDQLRMNLLTARHRADTRVREAVGNVRVSDCDSLGRVVSTYQTRLRFWQELEQRGATGQLDVELNRDPDEPAGELDSVAQYIAFYGQHLPELTHRLDRAIELLNKRSQVEVTAMQSYWAEADESLASLARLCLLDDDRVGKLRNARNLLELDQTLDISVRHAQFWLAVHRYEAQWLLTCSEKDLIAPQERSRTSAAYMERYWRQTTAVTPCFVMTAYQLPKYFKLWAPSTEKAPFDVGRADLLIVDEAGQVDTSLGASAFALAQRALVVGDVNQLAPVWGIDPDSDEVMAQPFGLGPEWGNVKRHGLTASQNSSVMKAAAVASRWCYGPDDEDGLFLAEHFRCHRDIIEFCNELVYKGQLKPSRPEKGFKLEGRLPDDKPFLFREVPGAEDRRQGSSRVNTTEAEAIAEWIAEHYEYLCRIYGALDNPDKEKKVIGVVTPFAAQASVIRRTIRRTVGVQRAGRVTVGTAHALQGAERSVVLFSSVYGENSGRASFIDSTLELMNVAVSRAKDLFIVFGSTARWKDNGPVFRLVRKMALKHDCRLFPDAEPACSPPALSSPGPAEVPEEESAEVPPQVVAPAVSRDAGRADPTDVSSDAIGEAEDAMVASKMIAVWRGNGELPADVHLQAAKLNQALQAAGLIRKDDKDWEPTPVGTQLGIVGYTGERDGKSYRNVKYTSAARSRILDMIRSGRLPVK